MVSNSIKCQFFLIVILILSYGCAEKTSDEKLSFSSEVETANAFKGIEERNNSIEKPAVIYRSIDMGTTWFSFAKGIPKDATLSGIKQYKNKIYVATDYHGVFVTSNGEDNWKSLKIEPFENLDINCIEVEGNKLVIGTLDNGILVSKDDGLNWKKSTGKINNSKVRAFIKSTEKLYAGTDSGIFESLDMGNTWLHVFGEEQILGFTALNNKIYAATQNGALMYNGVNWKYIYNGDALHDIGNDGKYIYTMTIGQQLLKTKNDGKLWENAQNGITYPINFYTNELQHIGNNIFSAQWIGIYYSSNNGNSWQIIDDLPDSTAFSTLEVTDFGIITGISIR